MNTLRVTGLLLALASCSQPPPPPAPGPVKFTVGAGYQAGGEWEYPQNFSNYDATGLAAVIPDPVLPYTADNEPYDANALAGASPVLQLPCIVTVTNLENGYALQIKVNDRGPPMPGRILAVTPRVATLLGFPQGGTVEVEVKLDPQASATLDDNLGQGPKLSAAPVAGITAQNLGPPGSGLNGAAQSLTPQEASSPAAATVSLSGLVMQTAPSPGPLFVQIPGFGSERDAFDTLDRLYGIPAQVVPTFTGSRILYAVNAGPYTTVASADAALQQILARGIADPQIIIR